MSPAVYVALNTVPTQMLGILHKKGLSLLTLFISPNAEFTDVVTLDHTGPSGNQG